MWFSFIFWYFISYLITWIPILSDVLYYPLLFYIWTFPCASLFSLVMFKHGLIPAQNKYCLHIKTGSGFEMTVTRKSQIFILLLLLVISFFPWYPISIPIWHFFSFSTGQTDMYRWLPNLFSPYLLHQVYAFWLTFFITNSILVLRKNTSKAMS